MGLFSIFTELFKKEKYKKYKKLKIQAFPRVDFGESSTVEKEDDVLGPVLHKNSESKVNVVNKVIKKESYTEVPEIMKKYMPKIDDLQQFEVKKVTPEKVEVETVEELETFKNSYYEEPKTLITMNEESIQDPFDQLLFDDYKQIHSIDISENETDLFKKFDQPVNYDSLDIDDVKYSESDTHSTSIIRENSLLSVLDKQITQTVEIANEKLSNGEVIKIIDPENYSPTEKKKPDESGKVYYRIQKGSKVIKFDDV
jgi:hypothetical protein